MGDLERHFQRVFRGMMLGAGLVGAAGGALIVWLVMRR